MIKQAKFFIVTFLALILLIPAGQVQAGGEIIIELDETEVVSDSPAFIENSRTLVPVRFISEALGFDVAWDQSQRKATISGEGTELVLYDRLMTYYHNGGKKVSDVAPRVISGRTYVPLRLVAESFGLEVQDSYPARGVMLISLRTAEEVDQTQVPDIQVEAQGLNTTAIKGQSKATADQMAAFLLSKNPNPKIMCSALELAQHFLDEGAREGIRGDYAFCQAIKETGYFRYGGDVVPEQNNYAGIGTTGGGVKGAYFETPQIGVRAQIQHLQAYATKDKLSTTCVDPRYNLVSRGCAPSLEDLNGRWAVPGVGYGESILQIYETMMTY